MSTRRRNNKASHLLTDGMGAEDEQRTTGDDEHGASSRTRTARPSSMVVAVAFTVFFLLFLFHNDHSGANSVNNASSLVSRADSDAMRRTAIADDSSQPPRIQQTKGSGRLLASSSLSHRGTERQQMDALSNIEMRNQPLPVQVNKNDSTKDAAVDVLNEKLSPNVRITPMSDKLEACESTIVTGYFKIRSKFAATEYLAWMKNFLSVQDCLVIFSSAEMMDTLQELRSHAAARTVLIELEIHDLPIAKLHGEQKASFWQHQLDIDFEKKRHKSFELFWIWLSKSWCVRQAIDKNFFQSNIFMWQDIGSYRNKAYNGKKIMQHVELIPPKTLLWMAHHPPNAPPDPIWNDKRREGQYYFHSGSQGAGDKEAWMEYHQRFAETMDMFLAKDMFIGEDQCVLQGTCQRFPDLCAYVRKGEVKDNHYFGLRYLLAFGGTYNFWRMPGASVTSR